MKKANKKPAHHRAKFHRFDKGGLKEHLEYMESERMRAGNKTKTKVQLNSK